MDEGNVAWSSSVGMRVPVRRAFRCDVCGRMRPLAGVVYETALVEDGERMALSVCWPCHHTRNRKRWRLLRHLQRLARRGDENKDGERDRWRRELVEEIRALPFGLDGLTLGGRLTKRVA